MATKRAHIHTQWPVLLLFLLYILFCGFHFYDPFFWDSVQLGSKHAHFYFESNFKHFFLPNEINSGHFPGFGLYLAFVWKIFGKHLLVSHLALVPFILLYVFAVWRLVTKYMPRQYHVFALGIFLCEPTILAQCQQLSPDVILIAAFAFGVYAISYRKDRYLWIVYILLFFLGMRGLASVGILLFWQALRSFQSKSSLPTIFKNLIPVLLLSLLFYGLHYLHFGWAFFHDASPWEESFTFISPLSYIKNAGIIAWRHLDFGRWILWLFILSLLFISKRRWRTERVPFLSLVLMAISILSLITIPFSGLLQHRYFMPVYFSATLLFLLLLQGAEIKTQIKQLALIAVLLSFLSGHLWVYPTHIAQGWDSSLAYRSSFSLMDEAKAFITKNNIDPHSVGTSFPFLNSRKISHLEANHYSYSAIDLSKHAYILYSNINNDLDVLYNRAAREAWPILWQKEKRGVFVILYKRPLSIPE